MPIKNSLMEKKFKKSINFTQKKHLRLGKLLKFL